MIAGYASSVNLPNVGTESLGSNSGISTKNGECIDYTGRAVMHSMHYVPAGFDMCKLCICENGQPKVRRRKILKISIFFKFFF